MDQRETAECKDLRETLVSLVLRATREMWAFVDLLVLLAFQDLLAHRVLQASVVRSELLVAVVQLARKDHLVRWAHVDLKATKVTAV